MVISAIVRPKKTLISRKWQRNDSTSVCTLLQPEQGSNQYHSSPIYISESQSSISETSDADSDNEQPRRVIFSSLPRHLLQSMAQQHQIYKTFCPDCYCKSFPVMSCLEKARNVCCKPESRSIQNKHLEILNEGEPTMKRAVSSKKEREAEKKRIQSAPVRVIHRKPQEKPKKKQANKDHNKPSLQRSIYTQRREYYEATTGDYFTTLKQQLEELEKELKEEQAEMDLKREQYKRLQCRYQQERHVQPESTTIQNTNMDDLMAFRRANYFACHSSTNSTHPSKKCTNCIHKCSLNNNLKLSPTNPDGFGSSRCVHCQRSLSEKTLSSAPSVNGRSLLFQKAAFQNVNLVPMYNNHLGSSDLEDADHDAENGDSADSYNTNNSNEPRDKMILTTQNNEQLEVTLPHNFLNEVKKVHQPVTLGMLQSKTFKNFKVPLPAESMALRFQKGMIKNTLSKERI